ncbi:adenosylcobinamide-GDP ribazoletransferase [Derxia gummosa]|uniref:Adenosylcobinamide-GDP ribazoletransferase n=1 Tax=Derxia gummosa DSM 723 TaxID=1121388 RepID=A0A8B6X2G7_9BURK|nr:adenosylcobinamide-GDP ribazoletransferase [Derxia gummosa]
MNPLRRYLLALQFFTRIPVTGRLAAWVGFSPQLLRDSAAHFPGVGWLVGGLTGAALWTLLALLPDRPAAPLVAAALATLLGVMLTGAFHEDGLADLADGLGGSADRERALDIMKDSRIGSFGAIALVLALLLRCGQLALLAQIDARLAALGLFAAQVLSRGLPLVLIRVLPHVGDTARSKSKPLADRIGGAALAVGALWSAAALLLAAGMAQAFAAPVGAGGWLAACAGALLGLGWMWRLLARRLQGFTGDALGATQQVCEQGFLLGLLLAA